MIKLIIDSLEELYSVPINAMSYIHVIEYIDEPFKLVWYISSHTVNVYNGKENVNIFSIGNFKFDFALLKDFKNPIKDLSGGKYE